MRAKFINCGDASTDASSVFGMELYDRQLVIAQARSRAQGGAMPTHSSLPEANLKRADEPKSSSNAGMNTSLILTLVLSVVLIICALFAVPHWNWSGDSTRPENMKANSNAVNPDALPPGAKGATMPNKGIEGDGDLSNLHGQAVQGDTITNGPKGPADQERKLQVK